jgi:hypothetical protein
VRKNHEGRSEKWLTCVYHQLNFINCYIKGTVKFIHVQ